MQFALVCSKGLNPEIKFGETNLKSETDSEKQHKETKGVSSCGKREIPATATIFDVPSEVLFQRLDCSSASQFPKTVRFKNVNNTRVVLKEAVLERS